MKRKLLIVVLILLALIGSGCLGGSETLYVCPTGETVSDTSLCPKTTTAPPPTTTVPTTTTPPSTTTPPITTPPTTQPPINTPPQTTESPEQKPILEIVEETLLSGPGDEFWIGGKIRNNGEREVFFVQATLTLYDRFDAVIEIKNSAPLDVLEPGQMLEFNTIKAKKLKSTVARYTLIVRSEE